jgi:hypothetical protein
MKGQKNQWDATAGTAFTTTQEIQNLFFLIVVLPCMLTITQLLLQQNAHF